MACPSAASTIPRDPAMSIPDKPAQGDAMLAALAALQTEVQALTEAMYALHLQAVHLQAVACAAIDTHPAPRELQACFERQIEHTVRQSPPHNLEALNTQTQAWMDRMSRRAQMLAGSETETAAARTSYVQ